jgi:phosphatidylinositol glycan class Z
MAGDSAHAAASAQQVQPAAQAFEHTEAYHQMQASLPPNSRIVGEPRYTHTTMGPAPQMQALQPSAPVTVTMSALRPATTYTSAPVTTQAALPVTSLAAAPTGYAAAPLTSFAAAPVTSYAAAPLTASYGAAPASTYAAPAASYRAAPISTYAAPAVSFSMPANMYAAPVTYAAPSKYMQC